MWWYVKGGIILIAIAAIGVGVSRAVSRPVRIEWQGYAEADFVKIGPTQQGLLTALHVSRGDHLMAGDPLFDQDEVSDLAARDQARRQLDQAMGQLANLQAPGRATEIRQAEANLAEAKAVRTRAQADLARGERISPSGGVSMQTLDQMRADALSADAKVIGMQAALDRWRNSIGRDDEIKAQAAAVDAAKAAVTMADWRLSQRHVVATQDAVVADVIARPGETMSAGAPVVSLLPASNVFVRFFVPEANLVTIHYGDPVDFAVDGGPSKLTGIVRFIAPHAEYTPPVIYSDQSRAKLVFLVEARPTPEQAGLLKPGQPVIVRPRTMVGAR